MSPYFCNLRKRYRNLYDFVEAIKNKYSSRYLDGWGSQCYYEIKCTPTIKNAILLAYCQMIKALL